MTENQKREMRERWIYNIVRRMDVMRDKNGDKPYSITARRLLWNRLKYIYHGGGIQDEDLRSYMRLFDIECDGRGI